MSPLALLPILASVASFFALLQFDRDESSAFIRLSLGWAAYAVLMTELLGLFQAVSATALAVGWAIPLVVAVGLLLRTWRRYGRLAMPRLPVPTSLFLRIVAASVIAIILLTAVVAWFAPPNTWDALNYHMSRVAHWAQQHDLAHYATGREVQNYMPPGASILVLQSYVLGHSDRLANFVQWFAMVGCLVVVARIASRLGAAEKGRWYAAAFAATLPAGIMQATSVATDYVVALWVAIAVLEVVDLWQGRGGPGAVVELGLAAGLAVGTKPTAIAYLVPFSLVVLVVLLRRRDRLPLLAAAALGLLLMVLLNLGYFARNTATFGSAAGPRRSAASQTNEFFDGRVLISNVVRNATLHLGTPSPHVNKAIALGVLWVHSQLGLDVNDPRTTREGAFRVRPPTLHETVAGNLAHALLLVALVPLSWLGRRRIPAPLWTYAAMVLLTFLLFSALFQWKPTGARYHLPFFVLLAPAVGVVLEAVPWRAVSQTLVGLLLLSSVPWLLGNHSRPLLSGWPGADVDSVFVTPREELLYANAPYLARPHQEIAEIILRAECRKVAIALPGSSLEYPIWSLLGAPREDLELQWLVAGTASARYEDPDFAPCAVVCEKCPAGWTSVRGLAERYHYGPFRLFLGEP
jgi:4-amino-4-deoxy-L-arabinose transferase-like glycosyltransferase